MRYVQSKEHLAVFVYCFALVFVNAAIVGVIFSPTAVSAKLQIPARSVEKKTSQDSDQNSADLPKTNTQTGMTANLPTLSFQQAVQLALRNDLTAQLAHERISE